MGSYSSLKLYDGTVEHYKRKSEKNRTHILCNKPLISMVDPITPRGVLSRSGNVNIQNKNMTQKDIASSDDI